MDIRNLTVCGNFPNHRTLQESLTMRCSCCPEPEQPPVGYRPPVCAFDVRKDHAWRSEKIRVRDVDLPILCGEDADLGRQHITEILRARDGEPKAGQCAQTAVQRLFTKRLVESANRSIRESEYVVPSTSDATHAPEDVGHKGSVLISLSQQGYPVPDFVVLTTQTYRERDRVLDEALTLAIADLESLTLQTLEPTTSPLILAIRCALPRYHPGIMPTFLNAGVTRTSHFRLRSTLGPEAADRIYLNTLGHLLGSMDPDWAPRRGSPEQLLPESGDVRRLIEELEERVGQREPLLLEDPRHQVRFFVQKAYRFYEDNRDLLLTLSRGVPYEPAIIVQKMVCSVRERDSYAGVLYSRHAQTGEGCQLDTARNIFGEAIMSGGVRPNQTGFRDPAEIEKTFPAVHHFAPLLASLEQTFESPVSIEFAVETMGPHQFFALLQVNESTLTGQAALLSTVNLHTAGTIAAHRVMELIRPYHLKQLESDQIDVRQLSRLQPFCSGVQVLPRSVVSARLYFSTEAALQAKRRGETVCLCKQTFSPNDTAVMQEMNGMVCMASAAIHVITICQSCGVPALLNLEQDAVVLRPNGVLQNRAGLEIRQGEWITLSSRLHRLYQGRIAGYRSARLVRYMKEEQVEFDSDEERRYYDRLVRAYRIYQEVVRGLDTEQIATLKKLIRIVNLDLRGRAGRARELVNEWFDARPGHYVAGVLASDLGDHLEQATLFGMLTLERQLRFFRLACERCWSDELSGYSAGAFMLGRFVNTRLPVALWQGLSATHIAVLVNEWILFLKYLDVLQHVGERRLNRARKQILENGLRPLQLHARGIKNLIPLKLSDQKLEEIRTRLPPWSDPQSAGLLDLLNQSYSRFYDYDTPWSLGELKRLCDQEHLPIPGPQEL